MLAAQSLIVIPLALHALGSRMLGAWLASGDVLAWMLALDLGLPHLIAMRVGAAHGAADARRVNEMFAAGTVILVLLAAFTAVGAVFVSPLVSRALGIAGTDARLLERCFTAAGLATALMIVSNSVVGYARGVQDIALVNVATFAGTLGGALVTVGGLLGGFGLWAFPAGLLARALLTLGGCATLVWLEMRRGALRPVAPSAATFREFGALVPAAGLGGVCYQLMTQSESVLIGVLLRPELVPLYLITKRGADVLRALTDSIALATYGGFAHLLGSADRVRGLEVHGRITNFRLILSVAAAAGFLAANASFVAVWAGPAMYGGHLLSLLIAVQMVVTGGSLLMNYLYRAADAILEASLWQIGEALVRVPLVAALLLVGGVSFVPVAGIVTSGLTAVAVLRKTRERLAGEARPVHLMTPAFSGGLVAVLTAGALLAQMHSPASWLYVIGAGGGVAIAGAALLFQLDPHPLIPRLAFR